MGILSFLKKQFIDVIEWNESNDETLAFRYPMQDNEIQNGGKLTVRKGQMALFVNEGQVADQFGPGLHTLTTQNLPILTNLKNWDKAFASPFKSDVVFFSTREKINQKWGTPQAVAVRDKEFGPLRIRAFGTFSYQIEDVKIFYAKLSGARDLYKIDDLDGQLKSLVNTALATFLGQANLAFLDMAANQTLLSQEIQKAVNEAFKQYGLTAATFFVQSVSLPEEVQAYLDKSSSMRVVGDLQKYAQFQAADSIHAAAENGSGFGGVGAGLAVGQAMGQTMMGALGQGPNKAGDSDEALATIAKLHDMVAKGILTQAEFDAKKAELLKKL